MGVTGKMTHWIQYRLMQAGEEKEICAFVKRVFHEFVAHQYSNQGIQEFLKYIEPQHLSKRCQADSFVLLAETKEKIVGMIELIGNCHISLFFVEGHLQRIGIGRELLKKSIKICRENNPSLTEITVNSSPNAVNIYEKIGFSVVEPEKEKNGIRFVPMKLEFLNSSDT
jgi:GNAT superfamily N-acetyltransferase